MFHKMPRGKLQSLQSKNTLHICSDLNTCYNHIVSNLSSNGIYCHGMTKCNINKNTKTTHFSTKGLILFVTGRGLAEPSPQLHSQLSLSGDGGRSLCCMWGIVDSVMDPGLLCQMISPFYFGLLWSCDGVWLWSYT